MFVFDGLKSLLPKINCTIIDNHAFRLHYKLTVVVLIAFVILETSREYIGDPISCMQTGTIPEAVLNQFCWVNATHSIPSRFNKVVGKDVPYHGIGQPDDGEEFVYHKYYQWVAFMLFLQAVMFYVPRYFWKMWEGGKMKMLLLEMYMPIIEGEEKKKKIDLLHDYLMNNLRTHNGYLYRYIICETFNLINIMGQIHLTDRFLGWEFLTFGAQVLNYISQKSPTITDPMIRVFPRMTKCTFHSFGHSSGMQTFDALCVLPLNIVNEKIYIFLWFWFITLAIVSGINMIYRLVTLKFATCRVLLLRARAVLVPVASLSTIVQHVNVGDWFVLYLLSKNMHQLVFADLIEKLSDSLGKKSVKNYSSKEKEYMAMQNL